jgi:membrane-associated phospholipid phosphatase
LDSLRLLGKTADTALLRKVTDGSGPAQRLLSGLTRIADSSKLWLGISGVTALGGGAAGRRMAAKGLTAIAATSALANAPLKGLARRPRPHGWTAAGMTRAGRRPRTSSFPSGHAASGFAFATAAGLERPVLLVPLEALAFAVALSRVQSGQHYPSDVAAGAVVGLSTGLVVHGMARRIHRAPGNERNSSAQARGDPSPFHLSSRNLFRQGVFHTLAQVGSDSF